MPFNSAARQIVFSEAGRAVETVLVGGRPVVRKGKLVTVDEAALAAEVEEIAPAFRRDAAGAGRAQRRSHRAAVECQPRGLESSARIRTLHRPWHELKLAAAGMLLACSCSPRYTAQLERIGSCSTQAHALAASPRWPPSSLPDAASAQSWPTRPVTHGGAFRRRQFVGHRGPYPGGRPFRGARAAGDHRECRRRRRHDRHRARGESGARRIPVRVRERRLHGDRSDDAQAAALQQRDRFHRGRTWSSSSRSC